MGCDVGSREGVLLWADCQLMYYYVARLCRRSANTVSEAASKNKNKQSSSLKSRDVDGDGDVSATIVPSVRAFPTRHRAKHGVEYREEEELEL